MESLSDHLVVERDGSHNATFRSEEAKKCMRAVPLAGETAAARSAFVLRTLAASATEAAKENDVSDKDKAAALYLEEKASKADIYAQQVTLVAAEKEYAVVQDNLSERIRGNDPTNINDTGIGASALAQLTYMTKVDAVADAIAAVKAGKLEQKYMWQSTLSSARDASDPVVRPLCTNPDLKSENEKKAALKVEISNTFFGPDGEYKGSPETVKSPKSPTASQLKSESEGWLKKINTDMEEKAKADKAIVDKAAADRVAAEKVLLDKLAAAKIAAAVAWDKAAADLDK